MLKQLRRTEAKLVLDINTFESANENNPNLKDETLDLSNWKAMLAQIRQDIARFEELAQHPVDRDARRKREQCQAAAPKLLKACEAVLMFLTNVNTIEPGELVAKLLTSMDAAGYDRDQLDDAAMALLKGAARYFDTLPKETLDWRQSNGQASEGQPANSDQD